MVTPLVIDPLEAVKVYEQDREDLAAARDPGYGLGQTVLEEEAIGESSEGSRTVFVASVSVGEATQTIHTPVADQLLLSSEVSAHRDPLTNVDEER